MLRAGLLSSPARDGTNVVLMNTENDPRDFPAACVAGDEEANLRERSNTFSDHDVRVRAHQIWVNNGRPEGHAEYRLRETLNYWREALAELEAEGLASSGPAPALRQSQGSDGLASSAIEHEYSRSRIQKR